MIDGITDEAVAQVCHEAVRGLQLATGDPAPVASWQEATPQQRDDSVATVRAYIGGDSSGQIHDHWCRMKREQGWTWGPVKDHAARQHPCLVPYAELDPVNHCKDMLFIAIIDAMCSEFMRITEGSGGDPR